MEIQPANSELELQLMTSQLTSAATAATSAWHVLGLLLRHGRPVRPSELASSCTPFHHMPDFIRFVCSIRSSPLRLTDTHSVTLSQIGFDAIAKFVAHSNVITRSLDPPISVGRLYANVRSNDIVRTYSRKRKRPALEIGEFPLMKKSYIQDFCEEINLDEMALRIPDEFRNIHTQGIETLSHQSPVYVIFGPAMFTRSISGQLRYEIENADQGYNDTEAKFPKRVPKRDTLGFLHQKKCKADPLFRGRFPYIDKLTAEAVMDSDPHPEPSLVIGKMNNYEGTEFGDIDNVNPGSSVNNCTLFKLEADKQMIVSKEENEKVIQVCESLTEDVNGKRKEVPLQDSGRCRGHKDNQRIDTTYTENFHIGPDQFIRDKNRTLDKQKMKYTRDQNANTKEQRETSIEKRKRASSIPNKQIDQRPLPDFESFIVEQEEGSGGYGTVYRARRKTDAVTFALKCPHDDANRSYVHNEMKMLERLGGKNFVIRYEGSFKSGSADCLVLEHVEHDRPEILKREINNCQLQWYGYCLFKALSGLHKQGIVHRDVKPGNFLYSRKANKGYLIDFNLALDMRKKYKNTDNSKAVHNLNDSIPNQATKSLPPAKSRKLITTRFPEAVNKNVGKVPKSFLPPGNLKKKLDKVKENIIKSQGADGSGITSAKDPTSTRTPSAERLREPLPSQGRKELLSLVQEARQGGNHESVNAPTSKRKRVAAPPANADSKFLYSTPMPLHANGIAIGGAGLQTSKGDGKRHRDGPCVGTKGFKAPEVLFRSLHQGPKADIWSAGVTLLYLMIGRAPFVGDTDQNIKEIAKLRGSEDLWEVAKLHNHESLFPMELLDVKYLLPVKLQDWCARNTKRPDFLESIPASLFDLVNKCLMVNPRQRISADEALRHDFFAHCNEALGKRRLQRQAV